jgi:hypothetical protein
MIYDADIDLEPFVAILITIDMLYDIDLVLLIYIKFVDIWLVSSFLY